MRKKYILILFIILISTGCTAEYKLTIEDDNYNENIKIVVPSSEVGMYEQQINNNLFVKSSESSDIVYNKKVEDLFDSKIIKYNHKFSFNEYKNSLSNKCFDSIKTDENSGIYSLIATKFECINNQDINAEKYKIIINTKYNVINNNADKVKDNNYIWNFDEKNYKNKSIIFQYTKTELDKSIYSTIKPIVYSFVASTIIIVVIIIITITTKKKKEMGNV